MVLENRQDGGLVDIGADLARIRAVVERLDRFGAEEAEGDVADFVLASHAGLGKAGEAQNLARCHYEPIGNTAVVTVAAAVALVTISAPNTGVPPVAELTRIRSPLRS